VLLLLLSVLLHPLFLADGLLPPLLLLLLLLQQAKSLSSS
jgi:hypothetical protein